MFILYPTLCKTKTPVKASTSGRIVRQEFAGQATKTLNIPIFIDDYNLKMRAVDIANQLRESYKTHKTTNRNWWPLFYSLIDVTVINRYRTYQIDMAELGQKPLTHLEFQRSCHLCNLTYTYPYSVP